MSVAAVILAAGASTRLGRPKQFVVFRGETLLDRAVRIAGEAADEVVVVTRRLDLPVSVAARTVVNELAAEGIASSIRAGVASVPEGSRILLMLVDQPLITAEHLRALVACDAPIAATGYGDSAGVPAVFAPHNRAALLALRGDRGARVLIEAMREQVAVVPFPDAAIDIDDQRDLELLGRR